MVKSHDSLTWKTDYNKNETLFEDTHLARHPLIWAAYSDSHGAKVIISVKMNLSNKDTPLITTNCSSPLSFHCI